MQNLRMNTINIRYRIQLNFIAKVCLIIKVVFLKISYVLGLECSTYSSISGYSIQPRRCADVINNLYKQDFCRVQRLFYNPIIYN